MLSSVVSVIINVVLLILLERRKEERLRIRILCIVVLSTCLIIYAGVLADTLLAEAVTVSNAQKFQLLTRGIIGAILDRDPTPLSTLEYNALVSLEKDIIGYKLERVDIALSTLPDEAKKLFRFAKIYLVNDVPEDIGHFNACILLLENAIAIYSQKCYASDVQLQELVQYVQRLLIGLRT
jgi:hypothetical protein